MSDKILQAINEVEIEISDYDKIHIDPDVKETIANRIARFLVKGVGNPNPVYDLLVQAHSDGKFPMNSAKGRGDFLREYANRIMVMFTTTPADLAAKVDGKTVLGLAKPAPVATSDKQLSEQFTDPVPLKAIDKESNARGN